MSRATTWIALLVTLALAAPSALARGSRSNGGARAGKRGPAARAPSRPARAPATRAPSRQAPPPVQTRSLERPSEPVPSARSRNFRRPDLSDRASPRAARDSRGFRVPARSAASDSELQQAPAARSTGRGFRTPQRSAASGSELQQARAPTRSRPLATAPQSTGRGFTRTRNYTYRGARSESLGYRPVRSSHHYGYYHGHHHHWYDLHGFSLSFHFGSGVYFGFRYYYPYYHYVSGYHYGFFYPYPVSYAYVPYGFYCDAPTYYVTRYVYVRDDYAETDYGTTDAVPAAADEGKVADPKPAAGSPATEKFLRDASEAFAEADYETAAQRFRLAALSAPKDAGPLFALGQALLAKGDDAYAARVIRKAVTLNPDLVKEPGDIVGVYKSQEEFDRVLAGLEKRAAAAAAGGDARFLLGVQRYFSGDPRSKGDFDALSAALPGDPAVELFRTAVEDRFQGADDLPPIR